MRSLRTTAAVGVVALSCYMPMLRGGAPEPVSKGLTTAAQKDIETNAKALTYFLYAWAVASFAACGATLYSGIRQERAIKRKSDVV